MNQTICHFKYVASWVFCALIAGFSPYGLGQALPPLNPVNVPNFTIPFEIEESANTIREIELFVSKDRGKRWHSVARQPVETKRFAFRADSDGEYWFAFRTTTLTGTVSPMTGLPQLRVLVDTKTPTVILPSQPSESGPLTPPKPARFRDGQAPKPQPQQPVQTALMGGEMDKPDKTNAEESTAFMLGPRLPGFELPETGKNHDADLLGDLLSEMGPFLDVQPVPVKSVPNNQVATDKSNPTSKSPPSMPAGGITGIFLNSTASKPQIVVRWNSGSEPWHDAQIDILRSSTKEGQPSPIAINLPNNGEYWWFLTPEDLKPFYVVVRIRSMHGGIHTDITQTAITIDPQLQL